MGVIDKLDLTIPRNKKLLTDAVSDWDVFLTRWNVISKNDIEKYEWNYPIYSSSIHNNWLFGYYGKYMFDEELISWSVDWWGNLFYRPKHKYSITNVSGILRIKKNYNYQYLHYLLSWQHSFTQFDYMGKAHPSVIDKMYYVFDVSLTEQKKIAMILSTLDDAIAITQALIDKHEAIKEWMMHDLFSRGIDPQTWELRPHPDQAPHLYKESELWLIPKEWEVEKMEKILKSPLRDFGSFAMTNLIDFVDDWIPFIKSEIVFNDEIRFDNISFITEKVHKLLYKSWVYPKNILLTKIGAIGRVAYYDGRYWIVNSNAATVKIDLDSDKVEIEFYTIYLQSRQIKRYFELNVISTPPRVNLADIKNMPIPYLSNIEQQQIANNLRLINKKIQKIKNKKQKLLLQKQGLMHDLLSGKVRVE